MAIWAFHAPAIALLGPTYSSSFAPRSSSRRTVGLAAAGPEEAAYVCYGGAEGEGGAKVFAVDF